MATINKTMKTFSVPKGQNIIKYEITDEQARSDIDAIEQSLEDKKDIQTAKQSPTASGNALAFIDTISQDENGEITATKKNVTIDNALNLNSENPVQNKVVKTAIDGITEDIGNTTLPTTAQTLTGAIAELKSDLDDKKDKQTAVSDPTASGTAVAFIDSISQNANGEITATKKTVQSASQSADGLMASSDKTKLDGIESGAQVNPGVATQLLAGLMSAADKIKLDELIKTGSTTTISANGTQTITLNGLTSSYKAIAFGCSTGENNPGADLTITPGTDSYTVAVTNYSSSFSITPVFLRLS